MKYTICDSSIQSGGIWDGPFLKRLAFSFVPVIIGGIYMYMNREWYENNVLKHPWTLPLFTTFIIYVIIAIVIAYIWYRIDQMCYANPVVFDVLFSMLLAVETFFFFSYFGQHDLEAGKIFAMFMAILLIVISIQIFQVHRPFGYILIVIMIAFIVQSRILYATFVQ